VPYLLSASEVMIHEEALNQVYVPLPLNNISQIRGPLVYTVSR